MRNEWTRYLASAARALPILVLVAGAPASAAIMVISERDGDADGLETNGTFVFDTVPSNSSTDLANGILPTLVGALNNSSSLANLTNGPAQLALANNISESTVANNGASPRFIIDLGSVKAVKEFNTYSAHSGERAAQKYTLYVATGAEPGFNAAPVTAVDPTTVGWTLLADVDTTPLGVTGNAQHGVSVRDSTGKLGDYRYFMMAVLPVGTLATARTNYGEADVVAVPEPSVALIGLLGLPALARRRVHSA